MSAERVLKARDRSDLPAINAVLRDQQFPESEVHFDERLGQVTIPVHVPHGADQGSWLLMIRGVRAWRIEHEAEHDVEVFRELRFESRAGVVVLDCLLDRMTADVGALDVTLACVDAGDIPASRLEDMPESVRQEVLERRQRQAAEFVRIEKVKWRIAWTGAAVGAFVTTMTVAILMGPPLITWVLAPLCGGGAMLACVRFGWDPLHVGAVYGFTGFGLLAAAAGGVRSGGGIMAVGPLMVVFCGALLHIAGGVLIAAWLREEESLRK